MDSEEVFEEGNYFCSCLIASSFIDTNTENSTKIALINPSNLFLQVHVLKSYTDPRPGFMP